MLVQRALMVESCGGTTALMVENCAGATCADGGELC